jgi:lycopene elongase/hydratase (dihydrobisanhydrobacterioruberin-forming)
MPDVRFLLKVSRPRFWLYVLGPYLVGLAAGAASRDDFLRLDVALFAIYFLFPANLLIYGVNDIFDFETDRWNPKKAEYEVLVRPESHRTLISVILLLNVPFFLAIVFLAPQALPSLFGFLFFSIFYSAPPIRAKQIPFLDSAFNILYVFPGAFAYQMLTGSFMPWTLFFAAGLWTMAMHAYSAIPDIKADEKAGVPTVATQLGIYWTHAYCAVCYILAAVLSVSAGHDGVALIGVLYVFLMLLSVRVEGDTGLFSIYRLFPFINAAAGFVLFWIVAFRTLLSGK